jgi:hypothetical protein
LQGFADYGGWAAKEVERLDRAMTFMPPAQRALLPPSITDGSTRRGLEAGVAANQVEYL